MKLVLMHIEIIVDIKARQQDVRIFELPVLKIAIVVLPIRWNRYQCTLRLLWLPKHILKHLWSELAVTRKNKL